MAENIYGTLSQKAKSELKVEAPELCVCVLKMNLGRAIAATGKVQKGPITTQGKMYGTDQNPEIDRYSLSLVHLKHTQIKVKFSVLTATCTIGNSALCSDRNQRFFQKSEIFRKSENCQTF